MVLRCTAEVHLFIHKISIDLLVGELNNLYPLPAWSALSMVKKTSWCAMTISASYKCAMRWKAAGLKENRARSIHSCPSLWWLKHHMDLGLWTSHPKSSATYIKMCIHLSHMLNQWFSIFFILWHTDELLKLSKHTIRFLIVDTPRSLLGGHPPPLASLFDWSQTTMTYLQIFHTTTMCHCTLAENHCIKQLARKCAT